MFTKHLFYFAFAICLAQILAAGLGSIKETYHDNDPMPTNVRVTEAEKTAAFWKSRAADAITKKERAILNTNVAKNVIFFLGDGMSIPTLAAARAYMGQKEGGTGEEYEMSFEKFPSTGLLKTYCVNYQVPDSACTATAYLSGVKTNYGTIGVTAAVPRHNCEASLDEETHAHSIARWAMDAGKDAGIVTTTRITHASPAGTYAHVANRGWESDTDVTADPAICNDIAHQLVHGETGKNFKVILGGGRIKFRPSATVDEEGSFGDRSDGVDLIAEWKADKTQRGVNGTYVWSREELLRVDYENTDYLLGLFESGHLQYHLERNIETEPTLSELTETAIKMLSKNSEGFFLFIEAGRIDHAHHDNRARRAMEETSELSNAVEKALELTDESDTLIVVSSDHAHVMSVNGYPYRGNDILGMTGNRGDDGIPYPTISYTNGPGYRAHVNGLRADISNEDMESTRFRYPADVPLDSETHGADDVAVFALGPYNHMFTGLYEQSDLPHIMAYAACIGPGVTKCNPGNAAVTLTMGILPVVYALISLLMLKFFI